MAIIIIVVMYFAVKLTLKVLEALKNNKPMGAFMILGIIVYLLWAFRH